MASLILIRARNGSGAKAFILYLSTMLHVINTPVYTSQWAERIFECIETVLVCTSSLELFIYLLLVCANDSVRVNLA